MRQIRNLLYFVVGVLLASNAVLSHAETTAALQYYSGAVPTYAAACDRVRVILGNLNKGSCVDDTPQPWHDGGAALGYCRYQNTPTTCGTMTSYGIYGEYYCPPGSTRSGATCTWTTPCANGATRLPDGSCSAPCANYTGTILDNQPLAKPSTCNCPAGTLWYAYNGCRKTCAYAANETVNAGWAAEYAPNSKACYQGCESFGQGTYNILKNGNRLGSMYSSGWACGTGVPGFTVPADDQNKRVEANKIKAPVCAAGDGVVTSSSGNVMCLPAGIPKTSTPQINVTKSTETFSDNSTKQTTTTKTSDPATGATDLRSTTVTSGGLAGPAGTLTSVQSSGTGTTGTGDGDGACDPTKDFCGGPGTGGLYQKKNKTVASVVGDFKNGVTSSGIGSAATGFFSVSTPGGACPNWVVDVAFLNTTLNLSQYFCTSTAISMMQLVGGVVMFLAAFLGFRWAIL